MKKYLIINADDFGLDISANSAIIKLARDRKITSTTVMANLVSESDLVALQQIHGISSGIHVNLLEGKPLSKLGEVSSLISRDGFFLSQKQLLLKALSGYVKADEVELEVTAQCNLLRDCGINISHADSHKHIHQYPVIGKYILSALQKNGIQNLRNCNVVHYVNLKNFIIKCFYSLTRRSLRAFNTPERLISDFSIHCLANEKIFLQALNAAFANNNCVEFMTHPAIENREGSYLNRKAEYEFWHSFHLDECLVKLNIERISYLQLL